MAETGRSGRASRNGRVVLKLRAKCPLFGPQRIGDKGLFDREVRRGLLTPASSSLTDIGKACFADRLNLSGLWSSHLLTIETSWSSREKREHGNSRSDRLG